MGRWYEALCRRRLESTTLSHQSLESSEDEEEEEGLADEDPEEENLLRSLDPKEWKVTFLTNFSKSIYRCREFY